MGDDFAARHYFDEAAKQKISGATLLLNKADAQRKAEKAKADKEKADKEKAEKELADTD